jgi:large repetitive protein
MAKKHSTPAGSQVIHRPVQTPKGLTTETAGWEAVWLQQNYKPTRMPFGPVVDVDGKAVRWSAATGQVSELKQGDIVAQGDVVLTSPDGFVMIQGALSTETGAIASPLPVAPEVLGDGGYVPTLVGRDTTQIVSPTLSHAMGLNLPMGLGTGVLPSAINHAPVYDAASNLGNANFNPNTGNYQLSTAEDTPISSQVQASDPDGDAVGYVQGSNPAHGSVVVNPDGTWTYVPAADYNGPDSFAVIASDGRGGQATSVVSINVLPVNDPPQTLDITATGNEDPVTPVEVALAATDVDSAIAGYRVITLPAAAHGVLYRDVGMTQPITAGEVVPAGSIYFMPAPNWNGSTPFQYAAIDVPPAGQPALEDQTPATATLLINPVNDAPVIVVPTVPNNNGQVTTPEDTPYTFSGVGNTVSVSDPDNGTLTATLTVENGTLAAGNNPNLTISGNGTAASPLVLSGSVPDINAALASLAYTPKPDWNGTDQLSITTTDPLGATATGTKPITVTPVADSNPDNSVTQEDIPLLNQDVLVNDGFSITPRDKVVIWSINDGSVNGPRYIEYGTVNVDASGNVLSTQGGIPVYDSAGTFAGQIVSVSRVNQGLSELLNFIPAPNYNNAVNGVPIKIGGNDVTLTVAYTVAPQYSPSQVAAGAGAETNVWHITVNMVNDPPVFQATIPSPNFEALPGATAVDPVVYNYYQVVLEDSSPASSTANTGKVHAFDVEDKHLDTGYQLVGVAPGAVMTAPTAHGSVTLNADGTWSYTPNPNYNGTDSFQVQVSDSNNATVVSTVLLQVQSVNDAPVFNQNSYVATTNEDTQVTGSVRATDIDSPVLIYTLDATDAQALLTAGHNVGVSQTGNWTFDPATNFNGTVSFKVHVNDGSGAGNTAEAITTVTVTVNPVNDSPLFEAVPSDPLGVPGFAAGNYTYNLVAGNTNVSGKVVATDADNDQVTYSVLTQPSVTGASTAPSAAVNPNDGTWTYTPAVMPSTNATTYYWGADSFVIRANDGRGGITDTTVHLDLLNPSAQPTGSIISTPASVNPGHVSALSLGDVLGVAGPGASMDQLLGSLGPVVSTSSTAPTTVAPATTAAATVDTSLTALSLVGSSDPLATALSTLAQTQQALNNNHHGGA